MAWPDSAINAWREDSNVMPKQYQLIPVSVQAIQITPDTVHRAAIWCGGVEVEEIDPEDSKKRLVGLNVPTTTGPVRASQGDFVVRDSLGQVTVMSQFEFSQKYQPI